MTYTYNGYEIKLRQDKDKYLCEWEWGEVEADDKNEALRLTQDQILFITKHLN